MDHLHTKVASAYDKRILGFCITINCYPCDFISIKLLIVYFSVALIRWSDRICIRQTLYGFLKLF